MIFSVTKARLIGIPQKIQEIKNIAYLSLHVTTNGFEFFSGRFKVWMPSLSSTSWTSCRRTHSKIQKIKSFFNLKFVIIVIIIYYNIFVFNLNSKNVC